MGKRKDKHGEIFLKVIVVMFLGTEDMIAINLRVYANRGSFILVHKI